MIDTKYSKIRPRRGTAAQWSTVNPVLAYSEMGIEYPDSGIGTGMVKIKFGDGSTPWNDLEYGVNPEAANAIYGGTPESSHDICLRSGSSDEWLDVDPVLASSEIVYDKTTKSIKLGDGLHRFSELPYIQATPLFSDDLDFDFGDEDEEIV